ESSLRPPCAAEERIFQWRGINTPPPSTIDHPVINFLANISNQASLRETTSYGSGLRKFHIFCDVFSIPEADRLPASFELLHSFALWAPVSVSVTRKYLSAIRAWHLAQGWPPPLSPEHFTRINWSLRGMENLQGTRRRPIRPPITLHMLAAIKATLRTDQPFDACIWAMSSCAFFGMMRFGEVAVNARASFDKSKHITRKDVHLGVDLTGKPYARLDLPQAKTAKSGETQSVFIVEQGNLCPIQALRNLAEVVPALPDDPLFSWRDSKGVIRPMVKTRAIESINSILTAWNWGTTFGHSFRIGGASFYLANKVDPEIVRIAGQWKSLAYETYIRAFEQVATQHL
ncbi:DNA breaking-rejoining enzyme, partial [Suillus hirtellus]